MVGGILTTGVANVNVVCKAREFVHVDPPPGQTCGQFLAEFIELAGISVNNPDATSACDICEISSTNAYLGALGVRYGYRWRDWVIFMAYPVFNLFAAVWMYYLLRVPKEKNLKVKDKKGREEKAQEKV